MLSYKILGFFFLLWAIAGLVTAAVERVPSLSEVTGSTSDTQNLGNNIFEGDEITSSQPVTSDNNPINAAWSVGNAAVGQVTFIFKSAALISPIWERWAQPIRWTILILQLPMLVLLLMEGARILSGFIPFT